MKWYVYFIDLFDHMRKCHCFEDDEAQARHFANNVGGMVCKNNEVPDWDKITSLHKMRM